MPGTLSSVATLVDLTGPIRQRREYVRKIVENFYLPGVDRETTMLRIGVQGSGNTPHYRIEFLSEVKLGDRSFPMNGYMIFNGLNHKEMTAFDAEQMRNEHWSTARMSFDAISSLLGELRKHS